METSEFVLPHMVRNCLLCGERFTAKKNTQVFCSSKHQYDHYNNYGPATKANVRGDRLKALERNEKVLKELYGKDGPDKTYSEQYLIEVGYEPTIFTGHTPPTARGIIYQIFEYGVCAVNTNHYKIIQL